MMSAAIQGAAEGGNLQLCKDLHEEMTRRGRSYDAFEGAKQAARGGHFNVLEYMVGQFPTAARNPGSAAMRRLAPAVASGCNLAAMNRFLTQRCIVEGGDQEHEEEQQRWQEDVVCAAAGSSKDDWREKLEMLESRGFPRSCDAYAAAAEELDAMDRFGWLLERDYLLGSSDNIEKAGVAAAAEGNADAAVFMALVLQALHANKLSFDATKVSREAAANNRSATLSWLIKTVNLGVPLDEALFRAGAQSGSVELMGYLIRRGCAWDGSAFEGGTESGSEAALEWLANSGCPMPADGSPLATAADGKAISIMLCLVRLRCPWGPSGIVFNASIPVCGLPVLTWLLAVGCPVNWTTAMATAEMAASDAEAGPALITARRRVPAWVRSEAARRQA
ncbi:hypothetical protein GPECTOR_226g501 [Gonium pectorale]|uniref:Uncharacterized protein n=1 Tax=Gonium pectorale TaxID=33097 RepID=A0A150FWM8_GONPE|nr:hypothetical protein GPECTOR_226g501 [Gonium pectorale]|eukprot:KXZ42006.1 hypothetical protein GPECTOR_226g501 [Gonium pectorale]